MGSLVYGSNALTTNEEETRLGSEVSRYEVAAMEVSVSNDAEYKGAAELAKQIKAVGKTVTAYWEEVKKPAYAAYKAVLDKEKEMTGPIKNAETILKGKMSAYALEKERKRQEEEATMRRLAEEEARRNLEMATQAEASGDVATAEATMAVAEMMEQMASSVSIKKEKSSVKGASTVKSWEITGIDPSKVPVEILGACIRPVDEKAVMRLIKASNGQIQIPGVSFKETVGIRVRA